MQRLCTPASVGLAVLARACAVRGLRERMGRPVERRGGEQSVRVSVERPESLVARSLFAEVERTGRDIYGDKGPQAPIPPGLEPPTGAALVLWAEGRPVGCGGVRWLSEDVGEIKRMYVRPPARRRGHGRRLLGELEETARALGYRRLRLDTGARLEARALFESAGYLSIPDYNGNALAAFWFEKELKGRYAG